MQSEPPVAESILSRIESSVPLKNPEIVLPSASRGSLKSEGLRRDWTHTRWAQQALRRHFVDTGIAWLFALAIWMTVFLSPKRRPAEFQAGPTLNVATANWIKSDLSPDYLQLSLFLRSTLSMLYDFTPNGPEFTRTIKGMVAPRIIDEADQYFARQNTLIKKQQIRQTFRMKPIATQDIVVDDASKRAAVVIHGDFEVVVDADPKARPAKIPVTLKVVVSPNLPSQLDPFVFYLESVDKIDGAK